ncbi:hypothetical protein Tco_0728431 [Tanacetum coccineum]|uniref:Uncharacterized protein n=1 Tax=Tanacetum coccineum TaxID=301880 RepID=A0ABQ4YNI8_9ASTR
MSTPAHFDSDIFSQTVGAQSSRVPTPLTGDPYVAVRQTHLVDMDTESGPVEDIRETEAHTPATVDIESELEDAPLETEEFEASELSETRITSSNSSASSDFTAPLSPDHPLTQSMSAQHSRGQLLCPPHSFRKSYTDPLAETPNHHHRSTTLPIWKRKEEDESTLRVYEDEFLKVGAQLELHGSILYDHTHRLDDTYYMLCLSVMTETYELKLGLSGRDEILFAERENHDLRMQIAEERRERLELTDRVARMERRQESRGE